MTTFHGMARVLGTAGALPLAMLLAGCAAPQVLPGSQAVNSAVVITADPAAVLANPRVEIRTEPAPLLPPAAAAPASGQAWIQETMARYGVYPEAGTQFVIGPMPAGCEGADGCTRYLYYPDTGVAFDYTITIRPGQLTEYLLFHEIGHARGIRDECGADNFARSVLGPVPGHYC